MEPDHEKEIRQIIGELHCPKDFICHKSGFAKLCEARDIGLEPYLECLEKGRGECPFLLSYAKVHLCDCPLRFYIAKKIKK
jgi:hypothetical protein